MVARNCTPAVRNTVRHRQGAAAVERKAAAVERRVAAVDRRAARRSRSGKQLASNPGSPQVSGRLKASGLAAAKLCRFPLYRAAALRTTAVASSLLIAPRYGLVPGRYSEHEASTIAAEATISYKFDALRFGLKQEVAQTVFNLRTP